MEALMFNRGLGLDRDEVEMVQRVVGATPDGEWGPRTVRAVRVFQRDHGLDADGKVGNATYAAIVEAHDRQSPSTTVAPPTAAARPLVGLWADDSPRKMMSEEYLSDLTKLGISEVALMVNKANVSSNAEPFDLRWSNRGDAEWDDDLIADLCAALRERAVSVVLTSWPLPDRSQIDRMCGEMTGMLSACGASAFEVDVEGNWRTRRLSGFRSMKESGRHLVSSMRRALDDAGLPKAEVQATTFGSHAELGAHPTVTPLVDRVFLQAYSTSPRREGPVGWGSRLGPGGHQRWIMSRAKSVGAAAVGMGLAAYKQRGFAGHSAEEAMRETMRETLALDVSRVRYWSSKWVLGAQRRNAPYAAAFLAGIASGTDPVLQSR